MSKNLFVGIDDKARKAKEMYIGINGKARKVVKAYIGDENGKARPYWEKETTPITNFLEFVSDNSFTMSATKLWDGTIEYNNGNGWTTWTGSSVAPTIMDGKYRIYFRGSNNTYIMGTNGSQSNAWKITGSNVECNGNLDNLLDYNTAKEGNIPTRAAYCFYHMFDSCEALVKIPALGKAYSTPVTNLNRTAPNYCFAYMFYGCSNILEPADLVYYGAGNYSYMAMYQNCIKLTKGIEFRNGDAGEYAYSHMFYGCSNLGEVKSFGTPTGKYIFYRTYSHCNSIKIIPDIVYNRGLTSKNNNPFRETFSSCLGLKKYPIITTGGSSDINDYGDNFYYMFLDSILPLYTTSGSDLVSYIVPNDKKAYSDVIISFYGSGDNRINLNATYYMKKIDYTITSIPTQYLTFSSVNPFSISNAGLRAKVFYSTDKTNWDFWAGEYETAKINSTNGKYEIYFAGEDNTSLGGASFKFYSNTNDVECNGNINTLLDHIKVENNEEITYTDKTFRNLFKNCIELISPPILPATTLASSCYDSMFYNCSNLKEAPSLPATTLSNYCYDSMFQKSGITTAPTLPATTLAFGCYHSMFAETPITTAPELPATTLPQLSLLSNYGVYAGMFSGCSSLTVAPALPATTLSDYCYSSMFSGCSSLTTAPALPATTLAAGCYNNMFANCKNLIKIPNLEATTLPESCYFGMFYNCPKVKPVTTQSEDYPTAYRIPTSGTGTAQTTSMRNMFSTSSEGTVNYRVNTTYYLPKGASIIS